jgi:hypothetical protein
MTDFLFSKLPFEIWLTGPIACGKDYIAKALKRYGYATKGVGELIAAEIEDDRGLAPGSIYQNPTVKDALRTELQEWGNRRRAEDPEYWIKAWLQWRETHSGPAIQTSCRFVSEAQRALARNAAWGAVVVKVLTPEDVRRNRVAKIYPNQPVFAERNPSEAEISRVPYNFTFFGTLPGSLIPQMLMDAYSAWQFAGKPLIDPAV